MSKHIEEIEENINLIRDVYKIPTIKIIYHDEKLNAFLPRSRTDQGFCYNFYSALYWS